MKTSVLRRLIRGSEPWSQKGQPRGARNIEGADHTGGYDTQPAGWRQQVVEFLNDVLR